jgi:hypothetical protein
MKRDPEATPDMASPRGVPSPYVRRLIDHLVARGYVEVMELGREW